MFCPYPTSYIYDRYLRTGVHSCAMPVCPYRLTEKNLLEQEVGLSEGIGNPTPEQREALERLREKYREEFGGDAMQKKRGGGHAPPD